MPDRQSSIRDAISTAELERRWSAARAAMRRAGLDAIVLQSSEDWMGGYTRWFTDTPATNAYPRSVIFPLDGLMTACEVGVFGGVTDTNGNHPDLRGIGRRVTTPSFNGAVNYTARYDAELMAKEVERHGYRTVGMVGADGMYHGFAQGLRDLLPGVEWVDATDLVDDLKAIKSAEEIALIRRTAAIQDEVMTQLLDYVRPGMKEFEVAAYMQYQTTLKGGSQGLYIVMATPPGAPSFVKPKFMQGREIEKGDVVGIMIECNGPGGFYTHLFRFAVMGKVPAEIADAHAEVLAAESEVARPAEAGCVLQGGVRGLQRLYARQGAARGSPHPVPRPGLRDGRAAAHSARRVDDGQGEHESRAPCLDAGRQEFHEQHQQFPDRAERTRAAAQDAAAAVRNRLNPLR